MCTLYGVLTLTCEVYSALAHAPWTFWASHKQTCKEVGFLYFPDLFQFYQFLYHISASPSLNSFFSMFTSSLIFLNFDQYYLKFTPDRYPKYMLRMFLLLFIFMPKILVFHNFWKMFALNLSLAVLKDSAFFLIRCT